MENRNADFCVLLSWLEDRRSANSTRGTAHYTSIRCVCVDSKHTNDLSDVYGSDRN